MNDLKTASIKYFFSLFICFIFSIILCNPAQLFASKGDYLIGIPKEEHHKEALKKALKHNHLQIKWCAKHSDLCVIQGPVNEIQKSWLQNNQSIKHIENDQMQFQQASFPDRFGTSDCDDQWELDAINITQLWQRVQGTNAPIVAIQDSGFRLNHEEYSSRINSQWDYGNQDTIAEINLNSWIPGHGSFIAALIAANGQNGRGRAGIMPKGKLNLQKISRANGGLFISDHIMAIDRLADGDLGVRVLNYSLGGWQFSQSQYDAIASLQPAGIILVTAAGNCNTPNCSNANNDEYPFYPGSYGFDHVITVAGVREDYSLNPYSHFGRNSVDLAAPGVNLCSASYPNRSSYTIASGTSYAAPIVSGVAALLLEAHPRLKPQNLVRILRASSKPIESLKNKVRAAGMLDAKAAVEMPFPIYTAKAQREIGSQFEEFHIENYGDKGRVCIIFGHNDQIQLEEASDGSFCWERYHADSGEHLNLPDFQGPVTSQTTVFCSSIEQHQIIDLQVLIHGNEQGSTNLMSRVVMSSDRSYLNTPFKSDLVDGTGYNSFVERLNLSGATEPVGHCGQTQSIDAGTTNTNQEHDAGNLDAGSLISDSGTFSTDAGQQNLDSGATIPKTEQDAGLVNTNPNDQNDSDPPISSGCQNNPQNIFNLWAIVLFFILNKKRKQYLK